MAEAERCDICGEFYDLYNWIEPGKYPNRITLETEGYNGGITTVESKDCYPNCMYRIGSIIYDLQEPGIPKPEFLKKEFNLPKEEKEIEDEHN